MMQKKLLFTLLLLFASISSSFADTIKMAYLGIDETKKNSYNIIFKIPTKNNRKLNLKANFPKGCDKTSKVKLQAVNGAFLHSWSMECKNGLVGGDISVDGLDITNTSLLMKLKLLNGISQTKILSKNNNTYTVESAPSSLQVVKTYTVLGIEHILMGFDHLLFVLSLLFIAKNLKQLILTITAFTLAHSITLAGVTFGYLKLPQQPVEAIIALSIMFLAMEIIHKRQGIEGIASRFPWIVSFAFGLLHGFGFAGALAEIGLPEQSIPLALLFFNVGVETGQLMFIATVIAVGKVLHKLAKPSILNKGRVAVVYMIGSLASFWFIDRVIAF